MHALLRVAASSMRQAIDSPRGRQLYSQRIGTVEPVLANIRHNKRLTRLNHRGRAKVNTQWNLYCMVHNIENVGQDEFGKEQEPLNKTQELKWHALATKGRNCGKL